MTIRYIKDLASRNSFHKLLQQTGGKISGENGAAALLVLHPNTLTFRMKKLELNKGNYSFPTGFNSLAFYEDYLVMRIFQFITQRRKNANIVFFAL